MKLHKNQTFGTSTVGTGAPQMDLYDRILTAVAFGPCQLTR